MGILQPSRPAVRAQALLITPIREKRLEGKAFPRPAPRSPTHPLLRGDPRNAPFRVRGRTGFAVTG